VVGAAGDPERAFEDFQEGVALLESGDFHAATVPLERARAAEPMKASIREALARAYYRSARWEAAGAEFDATLELDPVNDYAHFGRGLCFHRTGDRAAARRHLQLAVAMRPDNPHYQEALAEVLAEDAGDAAP
jgi:lipoprotein NlpI